MAPEKITLSYRHERRDGRTLLEDCADELNRKGGMKRPFPNENLPEIPLCFEVEEDSPARRRVAAYAGTLGKNDIDHKISGVYDRQSGEERVTMPYGWCGLHHFFEKKGFTTEDR